MRIPLSDIIDGIEMSDDQTMAFLDAESGDVMLVSCACLEAIETGEVTEAAVTAPAGEIEAARKVLANEDRYLLLPDSFEANELDMMRRFTDSVDGKPQEILSDAMQGEGAFTRYQAKVKELGLREAWFAFRYRRYRRVAKIWCEEYGVLYEDDAERWE